MWLPDPDDEIAARQAAEAELAAEVTARFAAEGRASAAEAELVELRVRLRDTPDNPGE